jgi:hypothetical protein
MALQIAHATSILKWAVIIGEGSLKLGVLLGLHPLSLVDMLHVIGESFGTQ